MGSFVCSTYSEKTKLEFSDKITDLSQKTFNENEYGTAADCTLTTYLAPQHGFVELKCPKKNDLPSFSTSKGFYPVDGELTLMISLITGSIFGKKAMVGGFVRDDYNYFKKCENGLFACAKAEFALTRTKVDTVLDYIRDIENACWWEDRSKCSYHLLGGNCVDFVINVAKVAGVTDDILTKIAIEKNQKNDNLDRSFFSLANKAWKYAYLKTYF